MSGTAKNYPPQTEAIEMLKAAGLARSALLGHDGFHGLTIGVGPSVQITCHHNVENVATAHFDGWNRRDFHYCPRGPWSEWVALAKAILAVDAALTKEPR